MNKRTILRWVYAILLYALTAAVIMGLTQHLVIESTRYPIDKHEDWKNIVLWWSGNLAAISFAAYVLWNFSMWSKLYKDPARTRMMNWLIFFLMIAAEVVVSYMFFHSYWENMIKAFKSISDMAIYLIPFLGIPVYLLTSRLLAPEICNNTYRKTFDFRRKRLGL